MLPLQGVTVIDMTRVLSGPFCAMILADFGADVIKIEMTDGGDDARAFGPYQNGESAYFMSINRNKKSVAINTKNPEGISLVKRLIEQADVVLDNFKPGTMEKIGLGYENVLRKINPKIIHCAISGYGQTGPWSSRPAYDAIVQAAGGIMSITGKGPGEYTRVGASIGDITAGLYAAVAIPLALMAREQTGEGQSIDIAMLDCQLAILENAIARYFVKGEVPQPAGNRHQSITPFENFVCADGIHVMVAVGNDRLWEKFLVAAGHEELLKDERFKTNPQRTERYDEIRPYLVGIFKEHPAQWWYDALVAVNVPVTFINTVDRVVTNEQVVARNMIIKTNRDGIGDFYQANSPIKSTLMDSGLRFPAPFLGEHTQSVLQDRLGLSQEELTALDSSGVIKIRR